MANMRASLRTMFHFSRRLVAPAQAQGIWLTVPLRGLSKSEEAADGEAVGGEMDGNARFTHCVSHDGSQYTTSFSGQSKMRGA